MNYQSEAHIGYIIVSSLEDNDGADNNCRISGYIPFAKAVTSETSEFPTFAVLVSPI